MNYDYLAGFKKVEENLESVFLSNVQLKEKLKNAKLNDNGYEKFEFKSNISIEYDNDYFWAKIKDLEHDFEFLFMFDIMEINYRSYDFFEDATYRNLSEVERFINGKQFEKREKTYQDCVENSFNTMIKLCNILTDNVSTIVKKIK